MDTIELMLALIRGSLNRRVPDLPQISYKEWEDLYWLSRKHGVVTIINDAIEMLPAEQQPQGDIAISWTLSAERTRFHFNHQAEVLNSITAKADEEGLRWILIKGMSLARLYPVPSSRACGDIDICFPNNYEKGNVLLGNPNATMDGKHAEIVIDGVTIENHLHFLDDHFISQRLAERFIWKSIRTLPDDGFLPPMANMVYLLMHTVCHLTAKYKLPLRNILDWGMFLNANINNLNPAECHKVMCKIGMVDSFNILTFISGEFVGTDLSGFVIGDIRQDDVTRLRDLILTKKYLEPVPKNLSIPHYLKTRYQRNRERRWLYRYLPSTRIERVLGIIIRIFKKD